MTTSTITFSKISTPFSSVSNLTEVNWNANYTALSSTPSITSSSKTENSDKTYYSDVVVQISNANFDFLSSGTIVELPVPKSYSFGGETHVGFSLGANTPSWATFDNNKNSVVVNTSAVPMSTEYSFELKTKVGTSQCEFSQTITIKVEK